MPFTSEGGPDWSQKCDLVKPQYSMIRLVRKKKKFIWFLVIHTKVFRDMDVFFVSWHYCPSQVLESAAVSERC